jgi:hypothetical protein
VGWGSGGPTDAHELAESSRQWTVKLGLQTVATATGSRQIEGIVRGVPCTEALVELRAVPGASPPLHCSRSGRVFASNRQLLEAGG